MHGASSEADFIYVTTQSLTYEQLVALSDDVGEERTLLVCCKAFHANTDTLSNLTVKKLPQAVLRRYEWGKGNYSLSIARPLPSEVQECDVPIPTGPEASRQPKGLSQVDLFVHEADR